MRQRLLAYSAPACAAVCVALLAGLGASVLAAVTFGAVPIPISEVYGVIAHRLFGMGDASLASGATFDIVWLIRLPRLVLAVGVGAALSVSGLVMQAVVKNPLADPYVLGVSSGASSFSSRNGASSRSSSTFSAMLRGVPEGASLCALSMGVSFPGVVSSAILFPPLS